MLESSLFNNSIKNLKDAFKRKCILLKFVLSKVHILATFDVFSLSDESLVFNHPINEDVFISMYFGKRKSSFFLGQRNNGNINVINIVNEKCSLSNEKVCSNVRIFCEWT